MSDYELRNAREWDATSSARLSSSHLSEELDDGFTKVQGSKAKRQAQVQAAHVKNTQNYANANGQIGANGTRHLLSKGYTNGRGGPNRARGRGGGRGHGISDHVRGRPSNPAPPPTRSSTQRHKPTSAAELASQRGEPATGIFSFALPRRNCHKHLQDKPQSFKAHLGAIGRVTSTHIVESSADIYSVLLWGNDDDVRQAVLRLEDLDRSVQPDKWAKNPAFDGRKENRRELKAHEEEQATRLKLFADSQEYPFEYSFIWPDSELSLQEMINSHDRPKGAFQSLRSAYQCSIRCDVANSTIIIQGMQERDVVTAGRAFERIARQMIAEMSQLVKISLLSAPTALLHQPIVSMDQRVDLKTSLYFLPFSREGKEDSLAVRTPKLWTHRLPPNDTARSRSEKMARRLEHFNRKSILAGLERGLTNLHFVQKAVRMQVDFGELAFLRYLIPPAGSQHHSFEEFRKTISKERTDILLQAMPPNVQIHDIIDYLLTHPALKNHDEASASVVESYVVAFDFRRPDSQEILRHEQEFGASLKNDEMEMRRKSWVLMGADSDRKSPMIISVLDFEKLDWQLKIQAYDILDLKSMAKEYADFEAGVGVSPAPLAARITRPTQRATWPRGYHDLVRVTNKSVIQFRLGNTDHILEIVRQDVYETEPFQLSQPKPESKWTASFYYSEWVNDLGEFAYKKHGETPSWEPSLSTFFPEGDETAARSSKKPRGPRNFLDEIEEVKDILWEAVRHVMDGDHAKTSDRVGTVENEDNDGHTSFS